MFQSSFFHGALVLGAFTIALVAADPLGAQTPDTMKTQPLAEVTVTATRSPLSTFDTPQPITVIDSAALRARIPANAVELFRDVPGLDMSGVGPNQRRPEIRGQRGQRILLLQDGLRLNNARRQQDFGEIPALAGIASVSRVEVVRGPSSVLYGTDAIGGVVNLISPDVPGEMASGEMHGALAYRYGSAGQSSTPNGNVVARFGRLGVRANLAGRDAADYHAPAGSFGDITFDSSVTIHDSGVRDRSAQVLLGYDLTARSDAFVRADFYSADKAGFGYVDPSNFGPSEPLIQILYPDQDYSRYTAGYRANALSIPFANRAEVSVYTQRNARHLDQNIFVPIAPGASVTTNAFNYTKLGTIGARAELAKIIGSRNVLTYGLDAFRDRSDNSDSSMTTIVGFGPPIQVPNNTPNVPNATMRSAGLFAQLETRPVERLTTVLGVRGQDVRAETRETKNSTAPLQGGSNRTAVWTANALYRVTGSLNAVASVGRGFRAANLVERFFEGPTPEANAYQKANADLTPERSINVDLGLRFRRSTVYAEGFVFRNDISDAIKAVPTGNTVNGQQEFQNRNLGHLRVDGMELTVGALPIHGIDGSLGFSRLKGKNISDPGNPIGDTYSSKLTADLSYRPVERVSLGYTARHQGEQKDVIVGSNPIGTVLPSFTVHSARASVRLLEHGGLRHHLALTVDNIGNTLYAEFPNASFFRPEPGRSVALALFTEF